MAFGVALRASRIQAGRSQEALSMACGLDKTYVGVLERGGNQPTLGTIFLLADELEVTAESLEVTAESMVTATRKAMNLALISRPKRETTARGGATAAKSERHKASGSGRSPDPKGRGRTLGKVRPKPAHKT
ncbi:helix-turn-helix domain-containing protein [Solimonas sp. SE-A11]|uniref:helix-turn-helix domain-containing protein n=1 Tax=Solimonas sp. SE-A11 TaxID=3054954 RepID=UPI00259D0F4B|nr:helix-turn-helix transcriptional regulator [Solimonas sp. SE-A11]MDM4771436.1 helix-turn-helix transcriptional regulator [Solimonas sp. SE-A11]